ncbi:methyl-accepting chemotaxis protein [candidate division WOR-3 bacterium]|nr:methyl-accepting chemotaxis protein [candidate division WOR-3 bacterium]
MDIFKQDYLSKVKDFSRRGSISTMAFCLLLEVVFLADRFLKFLNVEPIVPLIAFSAFIFGAVVFLLCRRGIVSPVIPFLITTVTAGLLTFALAYVNPFIRVPFFLIYFYIIIHPAEFLGRINGLYAVVIIDVFYLIMVFATHSRHPWLDLNIEILKLLILTFIGLLLVIDFDRTIQRLHRIRAATTEAEKGNLAVRVDDSKTDEVGFLARSFNRIITAQGDLVKMIRDVVMNLTDMSEQIAGTASEMASSSSEIVRTTQRMTEGINQQHEELDTTITTGKTLSEVSYNVVNNVKKIEEFSVGVSDSASSAISQSDVVIKNMELIGERYGYLTTLMTKLQVISNTINKIVNTIDSIAEKINILSLNASIEAARAGESGRGFSIVADEVKKLADSSQNSASEIARIIKEMMESIQTVTVSTEEVNKAISDGSVVVKSTAESLSGISSSVLELNDAIKNIKEIISREEQQITNIIKQVESAHGIAEENTAASEEILASIEEQSAATEEFSATSQELVSVANRLKDMVESFKVDGAESAETEPKTESSKP